MDESSPVNTPRFAIQTNNQTIFFDARELIYCLADGNYSDLYFVNRPKITISKKIKVLEMMLPQHIFFRIHQSHIVNLNFVIGMSKNVVIMKNGEELSIAKGRRMGFLECFQRI